MDTLKSIETTWGRVPAFFLPAREDPALLSHLWGQFKAGYLDNPAPPLFKEKLLSRLARYAPTPYALAWHAAALQERGLPALEIWALLKRPAPALDGSDVPAGTGTGDTWPAPGTPHEERLLRLAEAVFLHPGGEAALRNDLHKCAGPACYGWISALLGFARFTHGWIDLHRSITVESDAPLAARAALLGDKEELLADFLRNHAEVVARERRSLEDRLSQEIDRRRQMQEELTRYAAEMEESRDRVQDQANQNARLAEELYKRREELLVEIGERKKIEDSIRVYAEIVRNMPIGLNVWQMEDPRNPKSFRLIATNPAVKRFTGLELGDSLGRRMIDVFPYLSEIPQLYADVIASGHPKELGESSYTGEDGAEGTFSIRVFPLPNHCAGVSYEDVTERKEAETELTRARDAALELARVRSEFLANMSHEIRTPLNAIIGMTNLLMDAGLDGTQIEMARTASHAGDTLLGIINNILDFSKADSGKMTLEAVDFNLTDCVAEAIEILNPRAQAKGLGLSSMFDENVPRFLRGDPTRLKQIFLNLVTNAVKFTEKGEVVVRVTRLEEDGDEVTLRLAVSDTGIGIPPEALRRLFQAFSQADSSTTRKYGGTGLGLAICKRLVELMGGEIGVESEVGSGSTFWCRVRLKKAAPQSAPAPDAGRPVPPPAASASPAPKTAARRYFRILLVEDNPVNQRVAQLQMDKLGYGVEIVDGGAKALEALDTTHFDLVFMDCQMPDMDGFTTTREIRRRENGERHVPVVAMTANALQGDREKCLAAGMDDYLTKPVKMDALAAILARWDVTVDKAALESLRELADGDPKLARDVIDQFLKDAPRRMDAIRSAAEGRDAEKLEGAAHALKGACGNVGAKALWSILEEMENRARAGKTDDAAVLLEPLQKEFEKAREALQSERNR